MLPSEYLDVGASLTIGYRVSRVRRRDIVAAHVLIETAADVAAAARLVGLPVLSTEAAILAACAAAGVEVLATPPAKQEYLF